MDPFLFSDKPNRSSSSVLFKQTRFMLDDAGTNDTQLLLPRSDLLRRAIIVLLKYIAIEKTRCTSDGANVHDIVNVSPCGIRFDS